MSLSDLQSWLFDEGIREELNSITRQTIFSELDNIAIDQSTAPVSEIDWPRLLLAGSILAQSPNRSHQEATLRIATAAVTLPTTTAKTRDAGAVLFGKLSNFRAATLANQRRLIPENLEARLGITLRMEAQRRTMESAVLIESSGQWLPVNDFQKSFWENASKNDWLSASAPTASGKTFVVMQWLIDQMRSTNASIAVYLAPTRALVSEIENYLNLTLHKDSGIEASSLPLREKYASALRGEIKLILVFTQERLHLLINALEGAINLQLLIIDEAQKIGDNQRGIILQDAIERITRSNASLRIVFISPATQNPEELLADAPSTARTLAIDTDTPTVLQNLLIAEQVSRQPKLWHISSRQHEKSLPIGILNLKSSPSGLKKQLAFIAAAAGERGGTLVYTNGAAESEEVAALISQLTPTTPTIDPELAALAELSKKGVHPLFQLATLVEKGVAFHYGNMPSLIRLEIERLFRIGKLRFLVCTSTLIEGVNLSCRTIVVRGPRKGIGHPMEPHDFWNLAGRAGRWGDEFQGNILCIDPSNSNAWPDGIPARARYPIKRESDAVLERSVDLIKYLRERALTPLTEIEESEKFEHIGAYLLSTFLRLGSISNADFSKRHPLQAIEEIESALKILSTGIEIPIAIVERHPGVSALGLQQLLEAFRAYEGDIENLLPATVDSRDSYDRFVTIMRRINKFLYPAFLPESFITIYALIIVQWLKGFSLSTMIRRNIEHHKEHRRAYKLPALIRQTMEWVEQIARFRAPKYFAAYMDILHLHFNQIGRTDLIDSTMDIGTQLEFGVSSKTLLSLMEIGLSRMSAVALFEKIALDDLTQSACIEWILERRDNLDGMDIPSIIVREIREKIPQLNSAQ